jgi:hypothetical protein
MEALDNDSIATFAGILQPDDPTADMYPISITKEISGSSHEINRSSIVGVSEDVARAAAAQGTPLVVGDQYLEFLARDVPDGTMCIVGGLRGLFAYNPIAGTVTRLDKSTTSQIPRTQPFDFFQAEFDGLGLGPAPDIANPICSPSATGIPAS